MSIALGQKRRVIEEKQIEIIRLISMKKMKYAEGAKLAGVSVKVLREWVLRYKYHGEDSLRTVEKDGSRPPELKERAVMDYLSGSGSLMIIAAKYGVRSNSTIERWVRVYQAGGKFRTPQTGGTYVRKGRRTTASERLQIVLDCLDSGKNYTAMVEKYKVSYQQVWNWTLKYLENGAAGLEDRRGRRRENPQPQTELKIV